MAHAGLKLKPSPDVGMDRKMGISRQYCFLYLTLDTKTGFANNIKEFFLFRVNRAGDWEPKKRPRSHSSSSSVEFCDATFEKRYPWSYNEY
jgi:hypothetical protein